MIYKNKTGHNKTICIFDGINRRSTGKRVKQPLVFKLSGWTKVFHIFDVLRTSLGLPRNMLYRICLLSKLLFVNKTVVCGRHYWPVLCIFERTYWYWSCISLCIQLIISLHHICIFASHLIPPRGIGENHWGATSRIRSAWWRHKRKHFPRYWPFVRGIHRSRGIPIKKSSEVKLWCFLWFARE